MTKISQAATSLKNKVVFFGNERLTSGLPQTTTPILCGLIERGYDVVAIVSHYSDTRSRSNRPLEVAKVADEYSIPLLLPNRPADINDELVALGADIAVLVAYGRIIPQSIIDIFPKGIVNVHPSLLPKYRGPTPIEAPILEGDTKTGVSIMQLSSGMDSGPVYAQTTVPLAGTETKFELYDMLVTASTSLFFETFPKILDGSLQATSQDDTQATYCQLLQKEDGFLDPTQVTAKNAERKVRAYLGFPKTKLVISGQQVIVTKAHVTDQQKTPLDIQFRDGAYLSIDELIAPSGKMMSADAFLNGYAA